MDGNTDEKRMIRVVIKRPGEAPETSRMENTLEAFQKAVEGYIETVKLSDDVVIVCNEEGRLRDMEPNIPGFVGPLVFTGADGEEFTSLTEFNAETLMYLLGGTNDEK